MKLKNNETGLVAIVVSMLIMSILTLVTVGFSRLMQREYRQAIDRQLSTQALYAAESGINDVRQSLYDKDPLVTTTYSKTECDGNSEFGNYDLSSEAKITCLRVDLTPPTLEFSNISPSYATVTPVRPDGGAMTDLTITWSNTDDSATRYTANNQSPGIFPTKTVWGEATGLLRLDIIPIVDGALANRASLMSRYSTIFIYPTNGSGTPSYPYANITGNGVAGNTNFTTAQCSETRDTSVGRACYLNISGLGGAAPRDFYIRLQSYYNNVAVTIKGSNSGSAISFVGAQALVDSTGRNSDVVRRIKAQVPVDELQDPVDFGYSSPSDLCKLIQATPTAGGSIDSCDYSLNTNADFGDVGFTAMRSGSNMVIFNSSNNTGTGVAAANSCSWSLSVSGIAGLPSNTQCGLGNSFTLVGNATACVDATLSLSMTFGATTRSYSRTLKIGGTC